jgi:hypothetical protein
MLSTYQSDATAALQLSADERKAAEELKAIRPEVYPGSRAIRNRTCSPWARGYGPTPYRLRTAYPLTRTLIGA